MNNFISTPNRQEPILQFSCIRRSKKGRKEGSGYCLARLFTYLIIGLLFLGFSASAQDSENEWTLHSVVNGVEFHYATGTCNGENMLYLKFANMNAEDVTVKWREEIQLENNAAPNDVSDFKTITIQGGQIINESCEGGFNPYLVINLNTLTTLPPKLHAFSLLDIEVTFLN